MNVDRYVIFVSLIIYEKLECYQLYEKLQCYQVRLQRLQEAAYFRI